MCCVLHTVKMLIYRNADSEIITKEAVEEGTGWGEHCRDLYYMFYIEPQVMWRQRFDLKEQAELEEIVFHVFGFSF